MRIVNARVYTMEETGPLQPIERGFVDVREGRIAAVGSVAEAGQAPEGDEIFAEATLPAGEVLLSKLLSLGDGVRVLSPATLAKELRERAESLAKLY